MLKYVLSCFAVLVCFPSTSHAMNCYGGETSQFISETQTENKWVYVIIHDATSGQTAKICFTIEAWDEGAALSTIARYIYAVGDGYADEDKITRELSDGLSARRKYEFGRVIVYTDICRVSRTGNRHCQRNWE